MKNTNHLHTHFAYIFKMAMKRILHVIKQQVTPVRDSRSKKRVQQYRHDLVEAISKREPYSFRVQRTS